MADCHGFDGGQCGRRAILHARGAGLDTFREIWEDIATRPWLAVAVILAAALAVAFLVDRVLTTLLRRVTRRTSNDLDDRFVDALHGPVVKTCLLVGLGLAATQVLRAPDPAAPGVEAPAAVAPVVVPPVVVPPEGEAPEGEAPEGVVPGVAAPEAGPPGPPAAEAAGRTATAEASPGKALSRTLKILWTIGLLVWTGFGFRLATLIVEVASSREDRFLAIEPRTRPLFENLGKLLLFAVGTYAVVLVWGEGATGWIASAGIIGIAVSLAAQDTLANLFAGVFLIMDSPYRVGDYVNLESGERGKVLKIGLRSTRLLTRDEIEVTIPNSVMGSSRIVNESTGPTRRRLKVLFSVAYGSDVGHVKEVVLAAVAGLENTLPEPEPRVRFRLMGESSLDMEVQVWIPDPALRGRARDGVNTAIYEAFAAAGIEIPYPKRDVYVREMPAGKSAPG